MSGMKRNIEIIVKSIPTGMPDPAKTFEIRKGTINLDRKLGQDEILVKTLEVSLDPHLRNRLRDPSIKGAFPPALINEAMTGGIVFEVIKSNSSEYSVGDVVSTGLAKWAEYSIINVKTPIPGGYTKISNARKSKLPLSYYLGILGMTGITAYSGLHKICEPLTPGQTLFVSAAAGAVGQVVGQYAKSLGLRVVGSVGDDAKVEFLVKKLGFDDAFNYKKHEDFDAMLQKTCPNGINIYFDNVGGKMLDAVLKRTNNFARIAVCGVMSQYNRVGTPEGIHNLALTVSKRTKIEGFMVLDGWAKYGDDCIKTFTKLLEEGKMKYREDISKGIESLPEAFVGTLQGKNTGKAIAHIANL